jgi:hypothetical protein
MTTFVHQFTPAEATAAIARYNTGSVDGVFRERKFDFASVDNMAGEMEQAVNDYFVRTLNDYERGTNRPKRCRSFNTAVRENAQFLRARVGLNAKRANSGDDVTTAFIPSVYKGTQPTEAEKLAWIQTDNDTLIALARREAPKDVKHILATRYILTDNADHTLMVLALIMMRE